MIKVTYASAELLNIDSNEVLYTLAEYPSFYEMVLIAYTSNEDLEIYVTKPVVLSWYKNAALRYPQGAFVFEELDERRIIERRWQISLPPELTNKEIVETGLLELDIQHQPGQSFNEVLLAHFFAPAYAAKSFPFTQLASLLVDFDIEKWNANRSNPLLGRTLRSQFENWQRSGRSTELRKLVEMFGRDPLELKRQLLEYRVLRHYPGLGETVLGDAYHIFAATNLPLHDLFVDEMLIPETVLQVTYYLNDHKPQSEEEVQALIDRVSGLLQIEFEAIEDLLRSNPEWNSTGILDRVESKFDEMISRVRRRIDALKEHIRPPKPELPEIDWDVHQMLSWVTESYLPYQAWSSIQDEFDPDIYSIGDKFSDWLVSNWHDIHANSKRMVFNVLPNIAADLKDQKRTHLIIVVDNLSWSFRRIIENAFQEKGYFLIASEPYLSMLPTETETSKKCLLSGEVGFTAINDKTYKGMLEKGWVPYFGENSFRYISDIGKLSKISTIDANAYFINYLAIDKVMHKSVDEIGMPHHEHVSHLLDKLVDNVLAFVDKHSLQERIRIHVVSDHGSTRIPASIQNDLNTEFFKSQDFIALSHRYVEVSNERFANLADNLKIDCFFLPANDFMLKADVLCARRANRFITTDQDFMVHGGVLPEEVVVPYLTFEPVTIPLEKLTILLKRSDFRYRLETVEFELGNPNDAMVEQIRVSILNGNVESDPLAVSRIPGKTKITLEIPARFRPTSIVEEQSILHLRVTFQVRGERVKFDALLNIVMRKIVEEKSSSVFDD